jgi:hypothetical protein
VGWVFGQYVQANSASDSVAIASAPPLPTSPPQPTTPVQIVPIATAIPPTAIVQSQPLVGVKGQLHVDQNPIAAGGTVNAYWNVSNIQGIWFDKGDGNGYQAAGGSQSVAIGGLNNARLLQLKWRDSSGVDNVDSLTVAISGQAVATVAATNNCNSSDPNWRGSNPTYPFCVISDMDWQDSANSVRYVKTGEAVTVQWNIYGVSGIWLSVQGNTQQCSPAGTQGFEVGVDGNSNYTWHFDNRGSYIVHMKILRNDGVYTYYNEKFLNVGVCNPSSSPTNTPVPATATSAPVVPTATHTAVPTTAPTAAPSSTVVPISTEGPTPKP